MKLKRKIIVFNLRFDDGSVFCGKIPSETEYMKIEEVFFFSYIIFFFMNLFRYFFSKYTPIESWE